MILNNCPSDGRETLVAHLAGGGEMGERTRAFDWSKTPAGPVETWPQSLKTALRIMLNSRYAMWLGWGPDFTFFYNDAYAAMTLGPKHPWALGRSAREVWPEIWGDIGPRAEKVIATGEATWDEGLLLFLERRGFKEETYHTFSYSPLADDKGGVGGMLCVVTEDTERTIGERRLKTLRELAARTTEEPKSVEDACQTAAMILADHPHDLPFVLIYLFDGDAKNAQLVGATGLPEGSPAAPTCIDLAEPGQECGWPLGKAMESGQAEVVTEFAKQVGPLPGRIWPEPPHQAVVVPMAKPGQFRPAGFVVAGVSPRLVFNDAYKGFLDLLAGHVATAVANARAYEAEKRRAEALAEIDRAKTAFFSNVSHEFRTPLTLMLGPVEDLLARSRTDLSPAVADQLEVVNRNGLRLLRLVNSLLDFSRIEAGRVRAVFQPTELATFTADLASNFRSACERAGVRLIVDCPSLGDPVFVDRDMWEKVVLNLVSNAFKFTFEGDIAVSLRRAGTAAELRVRDTGTGIPVEEMPKLFERFHRIEKARGRTHEGSGIGLALVQELVKLHGGSITAESVIGKGTMFTVTVPLGSAHLPPDQIGEGRAPSSTGTGATPYVEEALRWLPDEGRAEDDGRSELSTFHESLPTPYRRSEPDGEDNRPRVLVADDNADMRQYVVRLLDEQFRVEAVPDGEAALAAARDRPPDLILTDVMMPKLNGFGLLKKLRADPRTSRLPVIMLSARAGEESRVEGMKAGADDYLVKPFGARELLARVTAHLQMARLRREVGEAAQKERDWLRVTLASIGDAVITTDTEGRITFMNAVAESVTGWTATEAGGQTLDAVFNIVNEATRQPVENPAIRALREGVVVGLANHTVLVSKDDIERPIDDSAAPVRDGEGRVVGCVLVFRDVTERRRLEKQSIEQAQAARKLAAIVDSSEDAIISKTLDGIIQSWNAAAERIFGYPADEAVGRPITMLFPADRLDEEDKIIARIRAGERVEHFDTVRLRKDGTAVPISLTISPVKDGEGRIIGASKIARDITERKRLEAELGQVAAELSNANRRKDEFLATLAHELRNPLAPLRNALQIIRLSSDRDAREQARSLMERQLGQMVRLVDDLMDVSRITRGKVELRKERVQLAAVLSSAVETSRPVIEQMGHELTVQLTTQPVVVDADPIRLAQVFANLLNNAAKYSDPGGHIGLTAERQGSDVVVSVKDTGIGIPPDKLTSIFDMFSQVDRSLEKAQGGLGIGLTLVRRLVEMHDGRVEARSEGIGRGSEFVVRLPVVVEASVPQRDHDEPAASKSSLRILIVDDNRDGADSLAMMLRLMGNDLTTAYDGQDGVEVAERLRPDVVLLDIGLPKLNGYEVARRIREQPWGKHPVLIAVTGWGQDEDRRRSHDAGFDHHIVKPLDPDALMRLLAELQAAKG